MRRDDLMPYQLKALDRGNFDLDPKLRVLCLAMLRVIGGGFLVFGCAGLSLAVCLWQGTQLAGFGLAASAAALLLPSYLAASSVAKLAPRTGAPTRLALVAAGVAGLAFVGFPRRIEFATVGVNSPQPAKRPFREHQRPALMDIRFRRA